jgi:tetratricopeptide (TPR) repeat protein
LTRKAKRQPGGNPENSTASGRSTDRPAGHRLPAFGPWIAAAVTALVFLPAIRNGFVSDDEATLLLTTGYRGFDPGRVQWMLTTNYCGHYQPLSWLTFAVDYALWGLRPAGFHLTNVLMHAFSAALVFLLARELGRTQRGAGDGAEPAGSAFGALFAALLFALHPLRVESVAWVTERRDVLGSGLLLASVLLYLRAHRPDEPGASRRRLRLSFLLAVASLLARTLGTVIPAILLLLDVWPLRRIGGDGVRSWVGREARKVWVEKIPFVLVATFGLVLAPLASMDVGASRTLAEHPLSGRFAQAAYGLVFYVGKLLWPTRLSAMYELRLPVDPAAPKYLWAAILVVVAAAAVVSLRRKIPALGVSSLAHVLFLLPVLGLFQTGPQEVADRYSYLPSVGWAILAGFGVEKLLGRRPSSRGAAIVGSLALLPILAVASIRQIAVWKSNETLWAHAVECGPPSAVARYSLAKERALAGRWIEAESGFAAAAELDSSMPLPRLALGKTLLSLGRPDEALATFREALREAPTSSEASFGIAESLARLGREAEAARWLRITLIQEPEHEPARRALEEYRRSLGWRTPPGKADRR